MAAANKAIGKGNGIFDKVFRALDPRASMNQGKRSMAMGAAKELRNKNNAMRIMNKGDSVNLKDYRNLKSEADGLREGINRVVNSDGYKDLKIAEKGVAGAYGVKDYYDPRGKSKKVMAARYGATAGAVGLGAVGVRYATGGTLTRDNEGNKDIAGIPFI